MVTALRVLLATAAVATSATSHAVLVLDYQFNDAAGGLSTASNSGSGSTVAPWANDLDATLNGNGQLLVTGQLNSQTHALIPASAITSGSAFLRIDVASWGSTANPFLAFGLRASGPGTPPTAPTWRLQFSSGDSSDNNPLGRLLELGGSSFLRNPLSGTELNRVLDSTIPATSVTMPNGFSVIMGVNLDTDTSSIWWDPGRTGNYQVFATRNDNPISSSGGFTDFNRIDAVIMQTNNGLFGIDRLALGTSFAEIASIPEPSLVAAFGAISVGFAASLRRRSLRSE